MPDTDRNIKRKRGIYLLPNLFTTAALFSGFYAVLAGVNGSFEQAAIAIFLAMVPIGVPIIFMALGTVVSLLQAFIFALLTMVYIGLALEEEH